MSALQTSDVVQAAQWLKARMPQQAQLRTDSRSIQPGDAFLAYPGYVQDGRKYVADAQAVGASACVVEAEGAAQFGFDERTLLVPGLKQLAGPIAAQFYGEPSRALRVIAVTGTNGKTSVTQWIAQALTQLGQPCAVVGTLGMGVPGQLQDTGLTTPDPVMLQAALHRFVGMGIKAVAMEASSIGIEEGRLNGTEVHEAVFTNFTQDHLDYHGTMSAYAAAKRKLFDLALQPALQRAVLNIDDAMGAQLAAELQGKTAVSTYSTIQKAIFNSQTKVYTSTGMQLSVREHGVDPVQLDSALIGTHNVQNLLAVLAVIRAAAPSLQAACDVLATLRPVSGRLEVVQPVQQHIAGAVPLAVVDYAHTPDALDKALLALRPGVQARGGKLWCVFGCGGDRDRSKRPLMAQAAQRHADHVVLTSDNPRTEEPSAILVDIMRGLVKPADLIEPDRAKAIAAAVRAAAPQDVVLIAGKGHEDYQIIGTTKHAFSDQAVAREQLDKYAARNSLAVSTA
jgi:UDP-N-acetylmuramoyl-L-alanyl-D-glutamate--2,6-diaminopimelate ligase